MLTIDARFIASELFPGLVSGKYSIEEGSTVRDVIAFCGSACNAEVPEGNYRFVYPLFNGRPVRLESELTADGVLHLCRVIVGG